MTMITAATTEATPCALCGQTGGRPRYHQDRRPGRWSLLRYGLAGLGCLTCYHRLDARLRRGTLDVGPMPAPARARRDALATAPRGLAPSGYPLPDYTVQADAPARAAVPDADLCSPLADLIREALRRERDRRRWMRRPVATSPELLAHARRGRPSRPAETARWTSPCTRWEP